MTKAAARLVDSIQAATKPEVLQSLEVLRGFVCPDQMEAIAEALLGEEQQYFFDKVISLANSILAMPMTFGTEGQAANAIVYLHYFKGGCEWFITEKDVLPEQHQAYGLADMGEPEIGYISIVELMANQVELDLDWKLKSLKNIWFMEQS